MNPREIILAGKEVLDSIFRKNGFKFQETAHGKSSDGDYASGKYIKGDRWIEFHFRGGLGLVKYHIRAIEIDHASYMRSLLGTRGGNQYPCFSDVDPLDAFRSLLFDLEHF